MKKNSGIKKFRKIKIATLLSAVLLFPIYLVSNVLYKSAIARDNRIPVLESGRLNLLLNKIRKYLDKRVVAEGEKPEIGKGFMDFYDEMKTGKQWFLSQSKERITVTSNDGLRLVSYYLPAKTESRKILILMHGYRSDGYGDFSGVKQFYHEMGYNLLVPHQRAHGDSEGDCICYGVKERYDVLQWSEYIADRFLGDCSIYLCGISMGAATVMMASNLELPPQVRGIIADCGFTSPWDIFSHVLKTQYHLPRMPFLYVADLICRSRAGFRFKECSTVQCLEQARVPVMFIHGEADQFVPVRMTYENYEACRTDKDILIVPGAAHGTSNLMDPGAYRSKVISFMERCESGDRKRKAENGAQL